MICFPKLFEILGNLKQVFVLLSYFLAQSLLQIILFEKYYLHTVSFLQYLFQKFKAYLVHHVLVSYKGQNALVPSPCKNMEFIHSSKISINV